MMPETEKELEKIYKEMKKWPEINKGLNYIIPKDEVERRELFLIGREEVCKLTLAKKSKDRSTTTLHKTTYDLIKATLELY